MGHDIYGFNKAGKEIAYARFSMGNYNSLILYNLLEANDYYAGVSGSGNETTFSIQQMENALNGFKQLLLSENELTSWDLKQISNFIQICFETAKKEGSVRVYFG
jgi:hypothetical protein